MENNGKRGLALVLALMLPAAGAVEALLNKGQIIPGALAATKSNKKSEQKVPKLSSDITNLIVHGKEDGIAYMGDITKELLNPEILKELHDILIASGDEKGSMDGFIAYYSELKKGMKSFGLWDVQKGLNIFVYANGDLTNSKTKIEKLAFIHQFFNSDGSIGNLMFLKEIDKKGVEKHYVIYDEENKYFNMLEGRGKNKDLPEKYEMTEEEFLPGIQKLHNAEWGKKKEVFFENMPIPEVEEKIEWGCLSHERAMTFAEWATVGADECYENELGLRKIGTDRKNAWSQWRINGDKDFIFTINNITESQGYRVPKVTDISEISMTKTDGDTEKTIRRIFANPTEGIEEQLLFEVMNGNDTKVYSVSDFAIGAYVSNEFFNDPETPGFEEVIYELATPVTSNNFIPIKTIGTLSSPVISQRNKA